MKFSIFSFLLIFSIFQVVFSYSGYESWKIRINRLEQWRNETEKILQEGTEFYNKEISSNAGNQLLDLTTSAIDNVTNTVFSTLNKIKDFNNTNGNECKDIFPCFEKAKDELQEVIENECSSFEKCRNDALKNITDIQVEFENLRKYQQEISTRIRVEVKEEQGSCSKPLNVYNYNIGDLCLACRAPKIRMSVVTFQGNTEKFKKRSLRSVNVLIKNTTVCANDYRSFLTTKIEKTEADAYQCILNFCNGTIPH